jgi:hypothetical protein
LVVDVVGSGAGSGVAASGGGSAARHAWLPWRGLQRPSDGSTRRLAAGVTPMAADPTSTVAWPCLVVVGGSSTPLPPGGSRWWPTSVLGRRRMTLRWVSGQWRLPPPMRSTGGQRRGGLLICQIKVVVLGFLLSFTSDTEGCGSGVSLVTLPLRRRLLVLV